MGTINKAESLQMLRREPDKLAFQGIEPASDPLKLLRMTGFNTLDDAQRRRDGRPAQQRPRGFAGPGGAQTQNVTQMLAVWATSQT